MSQLFIPDIAQPKGLRPIIARELAVILRFILWVPTTLVGEHVFGGLS